MADRIDQQLAQTLDKLFQRQSLERNIYIFNQMKPNLEIPISLIAKERKVLAITTDEKLVLQVLKKCDRVVVNEDRKTLQIKLQPTKSRLVIQASADKVRDTLEGLLKQFTEADYKIQTDKHNNLAINMPSEAEAEQLAAMITKQPDMKLNCVLEQREPYQELKDSIDRIKKQKKDKNQMFNPFDATNNFYQQPQWPQANMPSMVMPNMQAYNFNYAAYATMAKPDRIRGPGYTRRAVQSSDEEEPVEKRPKYREKSNSKEQPSPQKPLPAEEVQKRTRLNSQNFPSLEQQAKVQKEVLKHIYQKKDIVEVFTRLILSSNIKINKQLEKSGIPLLKPEGNFRLEAMKQGGRKESTFDSPKATPIGVGRKSSN